MSSNRSSGTPTAGEYWLPGFGLSRHIVIQQIQYLLGPTASARPYSYKGREGYIINGVPLTTQQIADLKRQSKEYERQETIRMSGRPAELDETQTEDADINQIVVNVGRRTPATNHTTYQSSRRTYR